ncbi:hypothetical protein C8Q76DRAFT_723701 [Earliella scabrosa]|nr:hypothetical protein C8Q76DRAFT_723701 [Earliella scabrosa]
MVSRIIATMEADLGVSPTVPALWKAVRGKDVPRQLRDFYWLAMHQAHRVGKYWTNIPGYEQRADCSVCGVTDSMEHILTECQAPGQGRVWQRAYEIMSAKGRPLPVVTLGLALAGPSVRLRDADGKEDRGASRLARIVITEATHLIWRLRCERVIQRGNDEDPGHTPHEIDRRWYAALDRRLNMDQALTSPKLRRDAAKKQVVKKTWTGVLANERDLPDDWVGRPGVLVGRLGSGDDAGAR